MSSERKTRNVVSRSTCEHEQIPCEFVAARVWVWCFAWRRTQNKKKGTGKATDEIFRAYQRNPFDFHRSCGQ